MNDRIVNFNDKNEEFYIISVSVSSSFVRTSFWNSLHSATLIGDEKVKTLKSATAESVARKYYLLYAFQMYSRLSELRRLLYALVSFYALSR